MATKHTGKITGDPVTYTIPAPAGDVQLETFIPWTLVKRNVRRQVITPIDSPTQFEAAAEMELKTRQPGQMSPLLRALGLAHLWQHLLDIGKFESVSEIAELENLNITHVRRLLRLTLLAPSVIETILTGGSKLNLETLMRQSVPSDWLEQETMLPSLHT